MGLKTPQHTHAQTFLQGLLKGRKYHAARLVLFVLACLLISSAIFMLSFSNPQASRTQQLAANMIQTEARAEVLLIASYDDADSATQMQRDALIDLLNRSSVGVDVEYLDVNAGSTSRNVNDASTYGASLATSSWGQALAKKMQEHGRYSAVVCIDDEALYYVEAVHELLFAQTPVVFVGVSDASHAQRAFELGYATGVMEACDVAGVVQTAKQMQPEARHLIVLTDNTATGLGDRTQFEKAASTSGTDSSDNKAVSISTSDGSGTALSFGNLTVDYLNASTMTRAELGRQLSSASSEDIIIYLDATADAAGNAYNASQTAYFVSAAATQPVYAVGFGGVGEGFIASTFIDYEKAGERAGEIVVMILNGTRPADIAVETVTSEGMVFDEQALSSAGISTSALPAGATLINQTGQVSTNKIGAFDSLRSIFLPISLLVLGIACIAAFVFLGYRRTANEVAEVVAQRNTLERRFYTDSLTDMPNMQWLTAYAASDASKRVRSVLEVALLDLGDLDELHGVDTADAVVKTLAKRLNGIDSIFLVRPNQSDFLLGFDVDLQRGSAPLDEVERVLRAPVKVGESAIAVSPCIGVLNRERGMSIEEMVAGVDLAIRQAEPTGASGEVVFYENDMRVAEEHKYDITSLLKKAIANDDLSVLYQPQIELATNEVVGYEALVRLRGDKYPPEQFIPIAEANGQIVELDRMVARKVVQQLATWKKRKQRIRPVSINFSYGQLCDEDFVSYLTTLLEEYGVARKLLRVDIKESLFVNDMAKARSFVDELYKAGFGIAIDGFGAGYTSIPRVMQIPVDAVKLDRSLTEGLLAHVSDSAATPASAASVVDAAPAESAASDVATGVTSATTNPGVSSAAEVSGAAAVSSSMSAAAASAPDTASEAATSAVDEAITSLINLVHEAGKIVVVEGVETLQQLEICRDKGCDVVQGFFFSEPLLPESVLRYKPPKISL